MNRLTKSALVLAVLILLTAGTAHLWLDMAIKQAVEDTGSRVAQGPVALRDARVSLITGRIDLADLSLGSSQRFKRLTGLTLAHVQIQFDWFTLWSDPIVIEDVVIDGSDVTVAGALDPKDVDAIRKRIEALATSGVSQKGFQPSPTVDVDAQKRVLVKRLVLTNGHIAGSVGDERPSYPLPDILLTDLVNQSGRLGISEATSAILTTILD